MFDPELFLSEYEYKDPSSGQNRVSTCRYRDATGCSEEDIDFDSAKNGERLSYFCVAIPGEAEWASEAYKAQSLIPATASISNFGREKRTRDDDENDQVRFNLIFFSSENNTLCFLKIETLVIDFWILLVEKYCYKLRIEKLLFLHLFFV